MISIQIKIITKWSLAYAYNEINLLDVKKFDSKNITNRMQMYSIVDLWIAFDRHFMSIGSFCFNI